MSSFLDKLKVKSPLDERFYSLNPEELAFFKSQTGIKDDDNLKNHIIDVQTRAYEIYPYSCVRLFSFTKLGISHLLAYDRALELGRERKGAIFLDIGCGFGNDTRKAVADGYPAQNVVASDLGQSFWDFGHELFKSTPESFPAHFIAGDAFDPAHLLACPPFYKPRQTPPPCLSSLTSLTPLHGHISVVYTSSLFHLFDEEKQLELAKSLASLLSPQPGSLIFGTHSGQPVKGLIAPLSAAGVPMFCHSPDSWRGLWDGQIFVKGTVQVEAELKEISRNYVTVVSGPPVYMMDWSVTRL